MTTLGLYGACLPLDSMYCNIHYYIIAILYYVFVLSLENKYTIQYQCNISSLIQCQDYKSTGPDNIPAWVLSEHAIILAAPLTSIFNSSLRQGSVPNDWKTANVIALPTTKPIVFVKTDIRPICLTSIASKVF